MMLNDVESRNDIQILSLSEIRKKDPDDYTHLIIKIPNYKIIQLLEHSILLYHDEKYVNGIIDNAIENQCDKLIEQHQSASLTYDDNEKIRIDVLLRFKAIAEYFETFSSFPNLRPQSIRTSIESVLGGGDKRVRKKYFSSIKIWLKKTKNQDLYYNSEVDLTGFKQAVLKKLEE